MCTSAINEGSRSNSWTYSMEWHQWPVLFRSVKNRQADIIGIREQGPTHVSYRLPNRRRIWMKLLYPSALTSSSLCLALLHFVLSPVESSDNSPTKTSAICSNQETATDLNKQRHERMILEIQLHLVTQGFSCSMWKQVRSKDFRSKIEWAHDRIFFVHFRTDQENQYWNLDLLKSSQFFSFVKREAVAAQFDCGQHV